EVSVDRLFNEGGNTKQGDSAVGGDHDNDTKLVTDAKDVVAVTIKRPRHQSKKRQAVTDASGSSHPLKKLRGIMELLVDLLLVVNPFTSSVSTTPGREGVSPTDSIIGLNLRTIGASKSFVISLDSSHYSSAHASRAEVDSIIRSVVLPSMMTEALVTSHAVNAPFVLVPETGTKITSPIREMDHHHLFTKFNVRTAHQACLNAEVKIQTEYSLSERKRLESE
nr:hypothetical protein [Tanacetum cinerariifolium]